MILFLLSGWCLTRDPTLLHLHTCCACFGRSQLCLGQHENATKMPPFRCASPFLILRITSSCVYFGRSWPCLGTSSAAPRGTIKMHQKMLPLHCASLFLMLRITSSCVYFGRSLPCLGTTLAAPRGAVKTQ